MMGGHHALTGAAAGLAVASTTSIAFGLVPMSSGVALATFGLMTAGGALLPDADHHDATIANALPGFGPFPSITEIVCRIVGAVSGGHRHGTHSLVGIAAAVALTYFLGKVTVTVGDLTLTIGAAIIGLFLSAFALKALKLGGRGSAWPWVWALGCAFLFLVGFPDDPLMLPLAVGLGCAIHILGDMLTDDGVPVFWPIVIKPPKAWRATPVLNGIWQSSGYLGVPILGNAGSKREWLLCTAVSVYIVLVVVAEAGQVDMAEWFASAIEATG